jgi:acetyl esterase/lipase
MKASQQKIMLKKLTGIALVAIVLVSCRKNDNAVPPSVVMNVAYGSHEKQKLDIYLPANRNSDSTRVIVVIHGGHWTEGDKDDLVENLSALQQLMPGYAIANINYRLATGTTNFFPTQENDVKSAIDFIISKKLEYKISDKLILMGVSSGAHLALLQAYKQISPVKAKAVISFFAPTDLVGLYNSPPHPLAQSLLETVTGSTPAENPEIYTQSSPVNFVNGQSPPTMLLHGDADDIVPISQAYVLRDALKGAGVTHQLITYPGEGHGWYGNALAHSFANIHAFLMANVK